MRRFTYSIKLLSQCCTLWSSLSLQAHCHVVLRVLPLHKGAFSCVFSILRQVGWPSYKRWERIGHRDPHCFLMGGFMGLHEGSALKRSWADVKQMVLLELIYKLPNAETKQEQNQNPSCPMLWGSAQQFAVEQPCPHGDPWSILLWGGYICLCCFL